MGYGAMRCVRNIWYWGGVVLCFAYGLSSTERGMLVLGASKRAKLAQAVRESEMKVRGAGVGCTKKDILQYNKVQIRRLKYAFWSGREGVVGGEEVGKEKKKEGDRIDVYVVGIAQYYLPRM